MAKLPQATSAAEHLKASIQEILSAFQQGAGIVDGVPEPMTFELASKAIWKIIDDVCYREWPKDADRRVKLRVAVGSRNDSLMLLQQLQQFGTWTYRVSWRPVAKEEEGGGEEAGGSLAPTEYHANEPDERAVVHAVGVLKRCSPHELLLYLERAGFSPTDFTYGL